MRLIRKISDWYFSHNALPYWGILFIDCTAVFLSGILVYYLQFGSAALIQNFWPVVWGMGVCLLLYLLCFIIFHVFRGVMRFSSFVDLHNVVYSTATATVGVCLLHQCQTWFGFSSPIMFPGISSAILIFIVSTMIMWGIRIVVKSLHDSYTDPGYAARVFIYGCLRGGVSIAKSIRSEVPAQYHLAGFISGDPAMSGKILMGVQVYYDDDKVIDAILKEKVKKLLVSPMQEERFRNRTTLVDALIENGIEIMTMPSAEEWDGKSEISHNQLREVEIEDLLPREKIEVDMEAIGKMLRGQCILITGAAGSIGSEMSRQIAKFTPSQLVLIDQAETPMHNVRLYMHNNHPDLPVETIVTSICKKERMEQLFAKYRPAFVFHAAAYKHVPMMEDNPFEAVQNNVYGTRVIADLAVRYGAKKFVMISTDKAVNPTNVMGCSKRICEIYCQSLNNKIQAIRGGSVMDERLMQFDGSVPVTQFVTTRFGNVLGSNGSVIPIFREQIKNGGPVMVTHPDIIRYFMLISEACRLVLEAGTMGKGGEIFVFDMGKPVKIVDLAKRMIKLSGAKNVEIQFSGLRDGEKLYEEVLNIEEQTKPTCHPKIKVASVREYPYDLALQNENELYKISFSADDMAVVKKMKEIVPEYKSQNSKYQSLDK